MRSGFQIAIGALAYLCCSLAGAAPATSAGEANSDDALAVIPLQRNAHNLYTLDVSVGRGVVFLGVADTDPLPFIFDTGANKTAIPRLIANQLIADGQISFDQTGHAVTGTFDTGLFIIDSLDFGLGPREIEVAVFEEHHDAVMSAAGILGSNAFQDEIIVLDHPARELRLLARAALAGEMPLRMEDGLIVGEGQIRGVRDPVRIFVDTGATASIVNRALVRRHQTARLGRFSEIRGVSGGVIIQGEQRHLFRGFQISDLCAGAFQITVSDVYFFDRMGSMDEPAILLGMDILRHARITIDYGSGSARIEGASRWRCTDTP